MAAIRSKTTQQTSQPLIQFLTALAIIGALYVGKSLFIPLALAVLFSFLLTNPVAWVEKCRMGRPAAVFMVVFASLCLAAAGTWLGLVQFSGVVQSLPQYRANLVSKLDGLRTPAAGGLVQAAEDLDKLRSEVTANQLNSERKGDPNATGPHDRPKIAPVPVQIVTPNSGVLGAIGGVGASVLSYLADAAAVVVLTLFLLLNRAQLRNRLLHLFGQGHLLSVTNAIDDAAERVSRYLLTQSVVNCGFGLLFGIGLFFIGVPYAPFWGAVVAVMRFLPYIGTFIAGASPFAVSVIVFSDWKRPLITLALYSVLEVLTSSVIEPWLYATRTGISSLAILLSAAFWTLLWGPIGLILSTPLTVCLAVLGRHLPPLEFLYVLLGDEPVLEPHIRYYQRLLASDEDEAAEVVDASLGLHPMVEVYDTVILPALRLAEEDRRDERLPEDRAAFILHATQEVIDEAWERRSKHGDAGDTPVGPRIGCIAAHDEADSLTACMLAQVLQDAGLDATLIKDLSDTNFDVICVSALPPVAMMYARALCRKIRRRQPAVRVILGVWTSTTAVEDLKKRLGDGVADTVTVRLQDAVRALQPEAVPVLLESDR